MDKPFPIASLARINSIYKGSTICLHESIPGTPTGKSTFFKKMGEFSPDNIGLIVGIGPDGYRNWRKILMGGVIGWICTLDLEGLYETTTSKED